MCRLFSTIADSFLELLSPALCVLCENYLVTETERLEGFCSHCLLSLEPAPTSNEVISSMIKHMSIDDIAITQVLGLTTYEHSLPIHKAIYDFKYRGLYRIAATLGKKLGEAVQKQTELGYVGVIPVPIHAARKRERGYNQAEVIADGVAQKLAIPILSNVLKRTKYTPSQTTLKAKERLANVSGLFKLNAQSNLIFNKDILLVDDIFTTGATVNNCAQILLEHGARRVDVAVIGIAGLS